jgi:hypothetical protein
MRTIALSLMMGVVAFAAATPTPIATLTELASDFGQGDAVGAIAIFDQSTQQANNIQALIDQSEVTCALEVISDEESNGVHKMDVDWILTLKSKADNMTVERRREQVKIEMRQIKGKWKITSLSPSTILEPIHII